MNFSLCKVNYLFLFLFLICGCKENLRISPPLPSNEIAFRRLYVDGSSIWTMDRDGKNHRTVWFGRFYIESLCWSPNGKKIAFTYFTKKSSEIRIIDIENKEMKCILKVSLKELIQNISFSPSGTNIIFLMSKGREGNKIYIMDSNGKETKVISTPFEYHFSPRFFPDGRKIIFASDSIYIMNIDGTNIKKIIDTSVAMSCPVVSPNGDWIAFKDKTQNSKISNEITLLNLENNEMCSFSLGRNYPGIFNMCVSPDGKEMAIEAGIRGTIRTDICTISLDTGEVKNLTNTPDCIESSPSWRPIAKNK